MDRDDLQAMAGDGLALDAQHLADAVRRIDHEIVLAKSDILDCHFLALLRPAHGIITKTCSATGSYQTLGFRRRPLADAVASLLKTGGRREKHPHSRPVTAGNHRRITQLQLYQNRSLPATVPRPGVAQKRPRVRPRRVGIRP